jgi:hypothetical protein
MSAGGDPRRAAQLLCRSGAKLVDGRMVQMKKTAPLETQTAVGWAGASKREGESRGQSAADAPATRAVMAVQAAGR